MRLPGFLLLPVCTVLTAAAYYLVLFTNWGNFYRGATYRGAVLTQAVMVLAVFACVEVMRSDKPIQVRALAGAFGAPLVAVTAWLFWVGVRKYVLG